MMTLLVGSVFAQQTITGKVTDVANNPIMGASVVVQGTTIGVSTDTEGNYSIVIPQGQDTPTLNFSFLGYEDRSMVVRRSVINIVMAESAVSVDEVVLVGYGSMRKSDITGSVASVEIDEDLAQRATSFDQLLQGRAAGVQVSTASAAPGGSIEIRIRGMGSLNGSNEPLYVVDGVILSTEELSGADDIDYEETQNALTGIDPADIVSMEVLKDASATAIYGSMGANGVILVTTRQGTSDKPRITWNSTVGLSTAARQIDILDWDGWAEYQSAIGNSTTSYYQENGELVGSAMDWQDYVMRTGVGVSNTFSISARDKKTTYYISFAHRINNGIVAASDYESYSIRANVTKTLTDKIKLSTYNTLSRTDTRMIQSATTAFASNSSLTRGMMVTVPYYNWNSDDQEDDEDDESNQDPESYTGPVAWIKDYSDKSVQYRITPNVQLTAEILDWLDYKFSIGGDFRNKVRRRWKGQNLSSGTSGAATYSLSNSLRYNMDNTLNINKKIGKHRINAVLGTTFNNSFSQSMSMYGYDTDQEVPEVENVNSTEYYRNSSYGESDYALLSYLARANYSFADRYVLTATVRVDGSSRFTKENRYSYFPSFAFAWRLTEEKFWNLPKAISNAKLRIGWGQVGSQASSSNASILTYSEVLVPDHETASGTVTGVGMSGIANEDLHWEITDQINLGLDLSFLDNRINFTVDAYDKRTNDMLQQLSIPYSSGFKSMWVNQGSIQNKGIEFALDASIVEGKRFNFSASANISFNRNILTDTGITSQYGDIPYFFGSDIGNNAVFEQPANIFVEGESLGLLYGLQTDGIVQSGEVGPTTMSDGTPAVPGSVRYVDQNNDGDITTDDYIIIGNPTPDFSFGFNFNFSYDALSLSMSFNGQYGNELVNANRMKDEWTGGSANIRSEAFYNAWTETNPTEDYPALDNDTGLGYFSDRIVEDASFLRLSSVTLGYSFKMKKVNWISSLRLNFSVSNVFILTNYTGYDPEVNSFSGNIKKMGIDLGAYPKSRGYNLGLNVNF